MKKHFLKIKGSNHCNICLAWHGCDKSAIDGICSYGAADLRRTDGGFFGAGIYVTPHSEYACQYSVTGHSPNSEGLYPMLLCIVVLGNTYPITRSADYAYPEILSRNSVSIFHYLDPIPFNEETGKFDIARAKRSDKVLKARYDSHFISVKSAIDFQAIDDESYDYDEIVVKSEHQLLPIAITYVKPKPVLPHKNSRERRNGALVYAISEKCYDSEEDENIENIEDKTKSQQLSQDQVEQEEHVLSDISVKVEADFDEKVLITEI